MQRDLSACIVQTFNGYEILKIQMKGVEKRNHEPNYSKIHNIQNT